MNAHKWDAAKEQVYSHKHTEFDFWLLFRFKMLMVFDKKYMNNLTECERLDAILKLAILVRKFWTNQRGGERVTKWYPMEKSL